jgi:hypothetical protein
VEAYEIHVPAFAVFRDLEQILHALESRLAGQLAGDVSEADPLD